MNKFSCRIALIAVIGALLLALSSFDSANCAPSRGNSNNNDNKNSDGFMRSGGILGGLFRRQTNSGSPATTTTTTESSNESETEDPQTQTELDAQKFMDSLPNGNANNSNNGPTTFRERVSDTFGVLRDGVSNHWKSVRDNFSDTVEDLRDTWTSSNQE